MVCGLMACILCWQHDFGGFIFDCSIRCLHQDGKELRDGAWSVRCAMCKSPIKDCFSWVQLIAAHIKAHPNSTIMKLSSARRTSLLTNASGVRISVFGADNPEIIHTFFCPGMIPYHAAQYLHATIEDLMEEDREKVQESQCQHPELIYTYQSQFWLAHIRNNYDQLLYIK